LFRKSIASAGAPGYFYCISTRFVKGKELRYSIAFWSVTKLLSNSFGVPITLKMIASWSVEENGKPSLYSVPSFAGDRGKHDFPGNKG
jgi:hypothetical protein